MNEGQAKPQWPDLSGRIENRRHVLPVRVYFEDTDFSGFVYHTSYLRFCERGRSDFLRLLGIHHTELHDGDAAGQPAAFVVRSLEVDYFRPAKIDDVLEIITECTEVNAASLVLQQEVTRSETVLVRVRVKVVLVSLAGKVLRIGKMLRDVLAE